jgi:hypothetical protein
MAEDKIYIFGDDQGDNKKFYITVSNTSKLYITCDDLQKIITLIKNKLKNIFNYISMSSQLDLIIEKIKTLRKIYDESKSLDFKPSMTYVKNKFTILTTLKYNMYQFTNTLKTAQILKLKFTELLNSYKLKTTISIGEIIKIKNINQEHSFTSFDIEFSDRLICNLHLDNNEKLELQNVNIVNNLISQANDVKCYSQQPQVSAKSDVSIFDIKTLCYGTKSSQEICNENEKKYKSICIIGNNNQKCTEIENKQKEEEAKEEKEKEEEKKKEEESKTKQKIKEQQKQELITTQNLLDTNYKLLNTLTQQTHFKNLNRQSALSEIKKTNIAILELTRSINNLISDITK